MSADQQHDGEADGQPARRAGIEQHVQSILLAVITAAVLYLGSFVIGSREDAVRWGGQIAALTSEVSSLRSEIATMRNNYVGREEYRDHEARIRTLESGTRSSQIGNR